MKPAYVIIGLGNPGPTYARTRHNLGFRAVDTLAAAWSATPWTELPRFLAVGCEATVGPHTVLLIKPTTYMNRSGECARKILDFYKLDPLRSLLVIVDELDLPIGTLRLKPSGGPGTHNGLRSLHEQYGESYARLRIGMKTTETPSDLAAWVLSAPPPDQEAAFQACLQMVPKAVEQHLQAVFGS